MIGITRLEDYLRLDRSRLDALLAREGGEGGQGIGREQALDTFHQAARRVPAYRDFLRREGVRPERIATYQDFLEVPPTDKANYIDRYPLEEMVWDGRLSGSALIHTSSGTTGEPYFWPSSAEELARGAALHEWIYHRLFGIADVPTLLVICFGMGTWIAGSQTLAASQFLNHKGHDFTIVTPGFDKGNTLKILATLAPRFGQTILAGIPSFVKDLVRQWRADNPRGTETLRFLLAGEGFPEEWRDHLLDRAGSPRSPTAAVSLYGSADAGLMGFETARSIAIRRQAAADPALRRAWFGTDRLPMLFQYVPAHRFFEERDGELLVTTRRTLPLVRYNLHDQGSVFTAEQLAARRGDNVAPRKLPFISVLGRGKFAATLFGANILAEDVQRGLLHDSIAGRVTGRFCLETRYSAEQDQFLEVHIELAQRAGPEDGLAGHLAEVLATTLRRTSTEYHRICQEYGQRAAPVVVLHPYGDPERFPEGVQQKSS